MPYIQPHTYVPNGPLDADQVKANERSLQDFVNQEIVIGDVAFSSLDTTDIAKGIYDPVLENVRFVTGDVNGMAETQGPQNRSYVTSTTKNNVQTTGIEYQDITNAGSYLQLDSTADVIVTVMATMVVLNNTGITNGTSNGGWFNEIQLVKIDLDNDRRSIQNATDCYAFEGLGAGSDTKSGGDTGEVASIREIMLTFRTSATQGRYWYGLTCDSHNEMAYITVKSIVVESFYI